MRRGLTVGARARTSAAVGTAVAAVVLGLVATVPASAEPAPAHHHAGPPAAADVALIRQSVVVGPEAVFSADIALTGLPPGAVRPPAPPAETPDEPAGTPSTTTTTTVAPGPDVLEVVVTVHERIRTRSAFARTAAGAVGDVVFLAGPDPLVGSGPNVSHHVRIPVTAGASASEGQLRLTQAGVYPVRVVLRRQDLTQVGELITYLVRVPGPGDDSTPLDVATVVPIGLPPALQPDGRVAMPGAPRLIEAIEAITAPTVAELPLDLQPTPETLMSLARLADEADEDADPAASGVDGPRVAAALEALRASARDRNIAPAPFVDLDPGPWQQAGARAELDAIIDQGNATLALVLGRPPSLRTWIAGPLTGPGLEVLHRRDYGAVVVAESSLVPVDRSLTLTRPFLLSAPVPDEGDATTGSPAPLPALMADDALSRAFPDPRDDPALAAHRLLADLTVLFFDQPSQQRGAVVMPPEDWEPVPEFLSTYLTGLRDHPLLTAVTTSTLLDEVEPATGVGSEPLERRLVDAPVPSLGLLADELRDAEDLLDAFASMLTIGDERAGELRTILRVAASDDLDAGGRLAYVREAQATVQRELASIHAPPGQAVTLTAREGSVPLTFQNTGGTPLRVKICLDNSRLDFPQGPCRDVTLSELNTTQRFPVRTRAAGSFPVEITVSSPDGQLVLATARVTVRSTALSGVGIVLTAGAGAFLVLWWATHWNRSRRARRTGG